MSRYRKEETDLIERKYGIKVRYNARSFVENEVCFNNNNNTKASTIKR